MRDDEEIQACVANGVFDLVIGVYCPWVPLEDKSSFNIDMWKQSDIIIPNAGTLEDLKNKVHKLGTELWATYDPGIYGMLQVLEFNKANGIFKK